jgi:transposase-like protein
MEDQVRRSHLASHPLAGTIARAYLDGEPIHIIAADMNVGTHIVAACVEGLTLGAKRDATIRQQHLDGEPVSAIAAQWRLDVADVRSILGTSKPAQPKARPDAKALLLMAQHKRVREIADAHGVCRDTVQRWLRWARVELGLPAPPAGRSTRILPHDAKLLALSSQHTPRQIAQLFGVHPWTVQRALKHARKRMDVLRPSTPDVPCEEGAPTRVELEDALERWGMDGVIEEYEVDYQTVSRWMRTYDL